MTKKKTKSKPKRIIKEPLKLKQYKIPVCDKFKNDKLKEKEPYKHTLKLSYDLINFNKKKTRNKKTKMSDFFDNVKNDKKINMPNKNEDDLDHNKRREQKIFNDLLKQEHFKTATSSTFMNRW